MGESTSQGSEYRESERAQLIIIQGEEQQIKKITLPDFDSGSSLAYKQAADN